MGLFVVTLLGSWSDQGGRRPVLILPSLGLALQAGVYLLVMYLKLPVAWFLLGRLLSGLSGRDMSCIDKKMGHHYVSFRKIFTKIQPDNTSCPTQVFQNKLVARAN